MSFLDTLSTNERSVMLRMPKSFWSWPKADQEKEIRDYMGRTTDAQKILVCEHLLARVPKPVHVKVMRIPSENEYVEPQFLKDFYKAVGTERANIAIEQAKLEVSSISEIVEKQFITETLRELKKKRPNLEVIAEGLLTLLNQE